MPKESILNINLFKMQEPPFFRLTDKVNGFLNVFSQYTQLHYVQFNLL